MKYIKVFEKWGINQELEDYTEYYISEMLKNPNKKKYSFIYKNEKGTYPFDIIIKNFKIKTQTGQFTSYSDKVKYEIQLTKRDDYSVLLHELKHFDRHVRKGYYNDILSKGIQQNFKKYSKSLYKIFYLFNTDEFEAKYHGYYVDINNYLSKNLKENPTSKDVTSMIDYYLKNIEKDKSFEVWKIDFEIDILKNAERKEIITLFNKILKNDDIIFPTIYLGMDIKSSFKSLVSFIKNKLGIYEITPENLGKLVKETNLLVNRNKEKFRKKFNRLYTIMVDKYVK